MTNPPRIAMLSYHTCPLATLGGKDTGGMNVYVRDLTRELGKLGVHVDIFTRSQDEHVPHVLHDLGYGNRVVHIPAGPEVPLSKQELTEYIPDFTEGIIRFAQEKNEHYDLIHSHYWMSGLAAIALRDEWDIPFVHMFHTLGLMKNRIARSTDELEGAYRIEGERKVLKAANAIIAATPAEQSQLEFLYKTSAQSIVIIPPGVDTTHFYPIPPEEAKEAIKIDPADNTFLFVGRIEPLKGIENLLKAVSILHESDFLKFCPHYLIIIGGNTDDTREDLSSEMKRLQQLTREYKINDFVIFLGKRSQDTLPYYYNAADVVVMPSHYESFGMVALEAMACGTPVIASQVGGLAYLVQDKVTGYVIPTDDPQALADGLKKLLCDCQLKNELSENAVTYAMGYDWSIIGARVNDLYQQIISTNSGDKTNGHSY